MIPLGFLNSLLVLNKKAAKEPTQMPKKVKFDLTDGRKPRKNPTGTFSFLLPLSMNIQRNEKRKIALGVRCDRPLALMRPPSSRDIEFEFEPIIDAGREIVVTITNRTDSVLPLDDGETVLRGVVLDGNFEIE